MTTRPRKTFVTVAHTVARLPQPDAAANTHEWAVTVDPGELAPLLAHVEYQLHETFANPRRRAGPHFFCVFVFGGWPPLPSPAAQVLPPTGVTTPPTYELRERGYGRFDLGVQLGLRDGKTIALPVYDLSCGGRCRCRRHLARCLHPASNSFTDAATHISKQKFPVVRSRKS